MADALREDNDNVELTVDELAGHSGVPVRTIREYQALGLLPSPERRGRVGIYRPTHVARLELIGRLQRRGYSLAGIGDLLASWREGADLGEVLGLTADQLVQLDEPGTSATLDQLTRVVPELVPDHLHDLLDVGVIDHCGPDRYCIPSPSLLQLTVDALAAGYSPSAVLSLLTAVHDAAELVAGAAHTLITRPPDGVKPKRLEALATRGRGLLAHGTGRLVIYGLGQRLGPNIPGRRARRSR